MQRRVLKRVLWLIAFGLLASPSVAQAEDSCLGFALPPRVQKVSENRFKLLQPWDTVMKFYRTTYGDSNPGMVREVAVSLPGVLVVHYENRGAQGSWQGVNVSRLGREAYVFCYGRDAERR